jgi:APA family basic amino acid/polyamine antiporter
LFYTVFLYNTWVRVAGRVTFVDYGTVIRLCGVYTVHMVGGAGQDLERSLGLYTTMMISMGAMIGSGIFVLPAIGYKKAGPAVVLAYVLAGLIVLPPALSKSEMATAMPESGGTYLYIDRALGPLFGTIAGIGAWFSLVFKSAFALAGLGSYLLLLAPGVGTGFLKYVALALAALIVVLNVVGTELTGKAQAGVVSLVLAGLTTYTVNTGLKIGEDFDNSNFEPFATHGSVGVITAAAFVFVSYAGVTKVASIAEEVKNPGKNLPRAIIGSLFVMMVIYTLVVGAVVGLSDPDVLTGKGMERGASLTPMADGAGALLGGFGVVFISVIAIVALTSMANAGVLASSRFPLAMSRDDLLPSALTDIDRRFTTPRNSILLTGSVLCALIAFVPVVELAKLASAFQILVFTVINAALIAFREADLPSYDPEWTSPMYPYVQVFGVVAGVALLGALFAVSTLSIVGAAGIITGSLVVYLAYGRSRTDRTGAVGTILERKRGETVEPAKPTKPSDMSEVAGEETGTD